MQGTNKSKLFPISIIVLMKVILLEYLYTEFESDIRSQIIFVQKLYICIENRCSFIVYFHDIHRKFFFLNRCLRFVDMTVKTSCRFDLISKHLDVVTELNTICMGVSI